MMNFILIICLAKHSLIMIPGTGREQEFQPYEKALCTKGFDCYPLLLRFFGDDIFFRDIPLYYLLKRIETPVAGMMYPSPSRSKR